MNGPEVLSRFVGETEKNVRDLFSDAENDQRTQGTIPRQQQPSHISVRSEPFWTLIFIPPFQHRWSEWPRRYHFWWNWCYLQGEVLLALIHIIMHILTCLELSQDARTKIIFQLSLDSTGLFLSISLREYWCFSPLIIGMWIALKFAATVGDRVL